MIRIKKYRPHPGLACLAILLVASGCQSLRGDRPAAPVQAETPAATTPPSLASVPVPVEKPDRKTVVVLRISVEKIEGDLMVSIISSEERWKLNQAAKGFREPVTSSVITLRTDSLDAGIYAVKVFHDLNRNGKLDTNLIGIPTEPYAFSNNAAGTFGPPSFVEAAFRAGPGETVHEISIE